MKKYLIIITTILFVNCGSRKVEREKIQIKEVVKIDSIAKTFEQINQVILTKKDIEKTEFNYEPIDVKAEFIIDGKVFKNVRISNKKETDNTIIKEDKKALKKVDIAVKKDINETKKAALEVSDKKGIDLITKICIIIVAIALIIGAGYLYINK